MATIIELLVILFSSFGLGLIPFGGPSNLIIASNAVVLLNASDPWVLLAVGLSVAIGVSAAKTIHYLVTFFVRKHLSVQRQQHLDEEAEKVRKWAFPLLFIAAATPIPDEPIVIPLGLMKYSLPKFFAAYFLGKLTITIAGAFLGNWAMGLFGGWLTWWEMAALSIALTVVITVILLKVDVGKLAEKYLKRKPKQPENAGGNN
jgi:uncharacterized membrane protein YdjX (TVP38/TMEM64 family)